jgi:hypothetical protein
MKKTLQFAVVFVLLCTVTKSAVFGGVEPSPFFPDINVIQLRFVIIKQSLTLPVYYKALLDTIYQRLASLEQSPQQNSWITPEMTAQGAGIIDRISFILINPQPEPPGQPGEIAIQLVTVMDRISEILINPQPEPPGLPSELIGQGFDILDRILEFLINPQPEPPGLPADLLSLEFAILDSVSWILINPQPEPPGFPFDLVAQGFDVLDRISWTLINPQPEPYGLWLDIQLQSILVLYEVADLMKQTFVNGIPNGTLPGMNALDQLSENLVNSVVNVQLSKVTGLLKAMYQIAVQQARY